MTSKSVDKVPLLFTPLRIRGITLKNRICVSPMCQYSCVDGVANDWHLVNAGSFATGGAGLVMIEATAVEERGRITPGCCGLWKDEQIEPLRRITTFIKSQGSVPAIQLAHAGRKASSLCPWLGRSTIPDEEGGWPSIGPSAIAFGDPITKVPKAATIEDIDRIKSAFVSSALRALKSGFEIIELHFAHGYLVSTFLSPHSNQRTDKYGGSLDNRMRLGLEIAELVRKALPQDFPLGVRVSVTDYTDNGWDIQQTIEFAKQLKALGIDFIDCSSGGIVSNVNYGVYNYDVPYRQIKAAKTIGSGAGIMTGAVGKIIDPNMAEEILKENYASLVFIARAFLNNPHWPYYAADVLGADPSVVQYPNQYDWCIGSKAYFKWRSDLNKKQTLNE